MSGKVINIGVIGYGVVGKGAIAALMDNSGLIKRRSGLDIVIKGVADLNIDKCSDKYIDNIQVKTKNAEELINDPEIDIIVELIGGYGAAKTFITKAIAGGKHVVTANKALLAMYGEEIFSLAKEKNVYLGFEASVGGGIPIIRIMKEDYSANDVYEITAIINGTANYILTRMTKEAKAFSEILKDAQEQGYAESDPTFDVEGIDSAHKICLLASLAFSTFIPFEKVFVEGISDIKPIDIQIARELGCVIKLLAIAKKDEKGADVRVHPTIIPKTNMLASVDGVFNAICVTGDKVDTTMHYGRGAGGAPTGSAVAADVINIARDIVSCNGVMRTPVFIMNDEKIPVKNISDVKSSFYLRFSVADNPGVLATIGGTLAKYNISVSSALQREKDGQTMAVPLVFMTHEVLGSDIISAVAEIDALPVVLDKTVVMRVESE